MNRVLVVIFLSIVLASCATNETYDWCYAYDFRESSSLFNVAIGEWVEDVGLVSDNGVISISFENNNFINARKTIIGVSRTANSTAGIIDISAAGSIYNINAFLSATLNPDLYEADAQIVASDTTSEGKLINASIEANDRVTLSRTEIAVEYIQLFGYGSSPFPDALTLCDSGIPPSQTAAPPAPTATGTSTLTQTPNLTASSTPSVTSTSTVTATPSTTPSPSPSSTWACVWDFQNGGAYGWTGVNNSFGQPQGDLISGEGWRHVLSQATLNRYMSVNILGVNTNSTTMTEMSVTLNVVTNGSWNGTAGERVLYDTITARRDESTGIGATTFNWSGSVTVGDFNVSQFNGRGTTAYTGDGLAYVQMVTAEGTGTVPSTAGCTNTTPPTPTPLPTITNTPLPSPTSLATGTPGTPSRTPIVTATPQSTAIVVTSTPITPIPTSIINTATLIPSPTRFVTGTPDPSVTGTPDPSVTENEAEWEILDVVNQGFNSIANAIGAFFAWIGAFFAWLAATIENILQQIANFFGQLLAFLETILRFVIELLEIAWLIIQLLFGLLGLLINWLFQIVLRIGSLVGSFFSAPLQAIPGLPQCFSSPLSYDICAIYYIMDWTLFAPTTPGQLIIPLVLTMMNIIIIIRFIRLVLGVIRSGDNAAD